MARRDTRRPASFEATEERTSLDIRKSWCDAGFIWRAFWMVDMPDQRLSRIHHPVEKSKPCWLAHPVAVGRPGLYPAQRSLHLCQAMHPQARRVLPVQREGYQNETQEEAPCFFIITNQSFQRVNGVEVSVDLKIVIFYLDILLSFF